VSLFDLPPAYVTEDDVNRLRALERLAGYAEERPDVYLDVADPLEEVPPLVGLSRAEAERLAELAEGSAVESYLGAIL